MYRTLAIFGVWGCALGCAPGEDSDPSTADSSLDSGPGEDSDSDTSADTDAAAVTYEVIGENQFLVTNPTSQARMYVEFISPTEPVSDVRVTAILVPGGRGDHTLFTGGNKAQASADLFDMNYIVFDPEGRGDSEGVEDEGGSVHQDGLLELVRFATEQFDASIDVDRIGVISNSYGVTIATGMLSRHESANDMVKFLVDFEGPADRNDTGSCAGGNGHLSEYDCEDEDFWSQREAKNFVGGIAVPYARVQSVTDHVQPDHDHAILMINRALEGTAPMVWLNHTPLEEEVTSLPDELLLPDAADPYEIRTDSQIALELLEAM